MKRRMIFDVESIGLHGEGFAVGYVTLRDDTIVDEAWALCAPELARGTQVGHNWVKTNCPWAEGGSVSPELLAKHDLPSPKLFSSSAELREWFWTEWLAEKKLGTQLWADVAWPVEARFLIQCAEDRSQEREWQGPYPLYDVSTYSEATNLSPEDIDSEAGKEATRLRRHPLRKALPLIHHPLCDARVSADKLLVSGMLLVISGDLQRIKP